MRWRRENFEEKTNERHLEKTSPCRYSKIQGSKTGPLQDPRIENEEPITDNKSGEHVAGAKKSPLFLVVTSAKRSRRWSKTQLSQQRGCSDNPEITPPRRLLRDKCCPPSSREKNQKRTQQTCPQFSTDLPTSRRGPLPTNHKRPDQPQKPRPNRIHDRRRCSPTNNSHDHSRTNGRPFSHDNGCSSTNTPWFPHERDPPTRRSSTNTPCGGNAGIHQHAVAPPTRRVVETPGSTNTP